METVDSFHRIGTAARSELGATAAGHVYPREGDDQPYLHFEMPANLDGNLSLGHCTAG